MLVPKSALAQVEPIGEAEWKRGYHGFALLCRSAQLTVESDLTTWRQLPREQTILIVLGKTRGLPVNVVDYVERGGAALVANDQEDMRTFRRWSVGFQPGPRGALFRRDMFRGHEDCPIATQFDSGHPALEDCRELITNRPGFLVAPPGVELSASAISTTIGNLPPLVGQRPRPRTTAELGPPLIAAVDATHGGRALLLADPSVFTNQMLAYGDNAQFALRTINWLREEGRTHVLILSDGRIADPSNPAGLQVELPPPNPEDVIAALKSLPPEVLVDFGNSVVAAVEDEGVIDELITQIASRIPRRVLNRLIILFATVSLLTYVFWRIVFSRNAAGQRRSKPGGNRLAQERQQAAVALVDQFRTDVAGGSFVTWSDWLSGLYLDGDLRKSRKLRRQIARFVTLAKGSKKLWSKRKLEDLEARITFWRQLHDSGSLSYDSGAT